MIVLLILLSIAAVPFGVLTFLLWRRWPDAGRALAIGGAAGVATAFGVFVVTLRVIDGMHAWDLSMGDYWSAAFTGVLSAAPIVVVVGMLAHRRSRLSSRHAGVSAGTGCAVG